MLDVYKPRGYAVAPGIKSVFAVPGQLAVELR